MKKGNAFYLAFVLVIVLSAASGGFPSDSKHANGDHHGLYNRILDSLEKKLIIEKPLPPIVSGQNAAPTAIIYVLGGGQQNLVLRFRKASSLYRKGLCNKIFFLSRPGITEYSPDLGAT